MMMEIIGAMIILLALVIYLALTEEGANASPPSTPSQPSPQQPSEHTAENETE